MRDLKTEPAWSEKDLGVPLPDTKHACSVCLPTWDSIIGYEEGHEAVTNKMQCGYPRFFKHPEVEKLFAEAAKALGKPGQKVVMFPRRAAAERAQAFVRKRAGSDSQIASYDGMHALVIDEADFPIAMEYWRYSGEIVSSRQAERLPHDASAHENTTKHLREKLASFGGYDAEKVFLYENGMAGIAAVHRAIKKLHPNKPTLQLDFPYVDTLNVLKHFGDNTVFLHEIQGKSFEDMLKRIEDGEFGAVFCEVPSNPLLRTVDFNQLAQACQKGKTLLVVDDTIASVANVQLDHVADIIVTSLTKWISGRGDVMGGQVTLSRESESLDKLLEFFQQDCPSGSCMFIADAQILAKNMESFPALIQQVNTNAEQLADYLVNHPAVENAWYPKYITNKQYQNIQRSGAGYSGLISFVLKSREQTPQFYNNLKLSKGPSLGTEFTLVCPYTLLAHYDHLTWAEEHGVDRHLIRISVGAEPYNVIATAFEEALD